MPASLRKLTVSQLQAELNRRRNALPRLNRKRKKVLAKLTALDAQISALPLDHFVRNEFLFRKHFFVAAAHETFDRKNRIFGVRDRLAFGRLSDQPLPVLCKTHHRRRRPGAFRIGDHHRLAALHDRHARIGRP